MRKEFNYMSRGIGDCIIAGAEYEYMLDSTTEAQKIANAVHSKFHLFMKPRITILRKCPKNLRGTANSNTGLIRLMGNGCNVGILLHELSHFDKRTVKKSHQTSNFRVNKNGSRCRGRHISHGREFKNAQTKYLLFWRNELKSEFNIKN